MATSDERREAAARLRGLAYGNVVVGCSFVARALGLAYEAHGTIAAFSGDAVARLADLIDPTCEMVDVEQEEGGYQGTGFCSECRELLLPTFTFCPHCGARVTDGGGD